MDVGDSGSFPTVHPAAALAMPLARRRSGLLTLRRGPLRRDIAFRTGQATQIRSNSPLESLPMLMATRGTLTKDDAVAVLKQAKEAKRDPGELLVEQGRIGEAEIEELRHWQAAFLVVSSAGWPEGTYEWRDIDKPRMRGPVLTIPVPKLLLQALIRQDGVLDDLQARLQPRLGSTLRVAPAAPFEPSELASEPGDEELIAHIDGSHTVSDVLADPPNAPERATALVWLLLATGAAVATGSLLAKLRGGMGDVGRRKATTHVGAGQREVIALGPEIAKASADAPPPPRPKAAADDGEEISEMSLGAVDEIEESAELDDETLALKNRLTNLGTSLFGNDFTTDVSARDLKKRLEAAAEEEEDLELDDEALAGLDDAQRDSLRELQEKLASMSGQNFFEMFGIGIEADPTEIRTAYFDLAKIYHPDRYSHEPEPISRVAQRVFAILSEASETLSDDARRQAYIDHKILGKKTKEEEAMDQARAIMEAEAAYKIGLRLLNNGQLTEAHAQFTKAHTGYPDEDDYKCYYGYTTFRLKQTADPAAAEEGEQLLRSAVQSRPKNPVPLHLLGKIVMIKGDDPTFARELFKRVVRLQPSNAEALNDLKKADLAVREAERKGQSTLGRLFRRK